MSKHTQGKWIARKDPNGMPNDWCIGLDDDCTPVDYVAVCNERDARLIAAAPDLLAALNDLLDTGFTGGPQGNRARKAVAKATGGAP